MRRRELLLLLGGMMPAAHAVRAQQKAMPVIGFLSVGWAGPGAPSVAALLQGLSEAGYVEGQNFAIEYRYGEGRYDRLPALAADLVGRKVDLIVTSGSGAAAAKNVTSTIPIVSAVGDPVRQGLVASLARPDGNLTGIAILTTLLIPKRFELLCELVPKAVVIGLLVNPDSANAEPTIRDVEEVAHTKGVQLLILRVNTVGDLHSAFGILAQRRVGALLISADAFFNNQREELVALASHHAIPASYEWRESVVAGGLVSYGPSLTGIYRQMGTYAGKILSGVKPADLPVQQPTRFELVINFKTAKALGLAIPVTILARADEIIE